MKKLWLKLLFVWMMLLSFVVASSNPKAVIIFDASGSMWGQINGISKIEIARDVLKNVIKDWNPSIELGVTAYGHRSKGDCSDIETIIPVGKVDKNRVISTVMKIQPKGKTPISRSLKKVANEIRYTEEKATIILISDGKETCDSDPCGTAKELEKEGIDFVTHVIGFNVDKRTDEQLECIASVTGGEYFSAKNAQALNEAMKQIVKKVEVVEEKPKPKPVVRKPKNTLEITGFEKKGGKPVSLYGYIYHVDENGNKEGSSLGQINHGNKPKKPSLHNLPSGKYMAEVKYNHFKKQIFFDIKDTEVTRLYIVMGETGTVSVTGSEKEGGKFIRLYGYIYHVDENGKKVDSNLGQINHGNRPKNPVIHQLPVGKYIAEVKYNHFKKKILFNIEAGKETKIHFVMGETGTVSVTGSEKEGGKFIRLYGYIYHVDEDGKKVDSNLGQINHGNRPKNPVIHQLPVGKYIAEVKYNHFKKKILFNIEAGKETKIHFVMGETGVLIVSASKKNGGRWIKAHHRIATMVDGKIDNSNIENCYSRKKEPCKVVLPIGNYSLFSKYNEAKKETYFEIKADEETKLHIIFGEFTIESKCSDMQSNVNYEIYASSGQMIYEKELKCSEVWKVTIEDGKYSVDAKVNGTTKEVDFTVGAGNSNKLLIDLTNINHESDIKEDSQ